MDCLKKVFFFTIVVLLAACGNSEQDSARQAPIQSQPAPATPAPATSNTATTPPPPPATPEPAQNAQGVWHYTCPNGHAGGAGSATTCPECGATLAHNSAYHGTASTPNVNNTAATPAAGGTPPGMFANPSQTPVNATIGTPPAPTAEPPQNAAGVWHYTCSNGCSGGAGSAIACTQCGNTLVHNQAYHN